MGQRGVCFGGEGDKGDSGDQVRGIKSVRLVGCRVERPGCLNEEHERAGGDGGNVRKHHNRGAPVNLSHVTGCHPVVLGTRKRADVYGVPAMSYAMGQAPSTREPPASPTAQPR